MTTTLGQEIHLSNCSDTPTTFSNARIEGPTASEFAIVQTPMGTTLGPNGTASWLVVLTASSSGIKHAEFVVDYDGGTARVPLDGEGLGVGIGTGDNGNVEEVSYYSCSAAGSGSSARAWPLVLVLGIALRRRRRRR